MWAWLESLFDRRPVYVLTNKRFPPNTVLTLFSNEGMIIENKLTDRCVLLTLTEEDGGLTVRLFPGCQWSTTGKRKVHITSDPRPLSDFAHINPAWGN